MGTGKLIENLLEGFLCACASDIGPRAGAKPLGYARADLDFSLRLRLRKRLRVGVGHDELDTFELGRDHVVDGIAAGAADAQHGDAWSELGDFRHFQLDRHSRSPSPNSVPTLPNESLLLLLNHFVRFSHSAFAQFPFISRALR